MDKILNEIHKNLIPMEINNYRLPYGINYYTTTNTNIPYNWPAFLAAFWLNSG